MKTLRIKHVKKSYVKYFNGFSLQGEEHLFESYFSKSDTTVVGFSYGAQKAFEYVYHTKDRVDKLVLLSPAFFQTQKKSFIRAQLRYYDTGHNNYIQQFLLNTKYPATIDISKYLQKGIKEDTKEELEFLLHYQWSEDKIKEVLDRHITIEVFLGSNDKIIDIHEPSHFFSMTTTYIIKGVGHLLKEKA